MTILRLTCAALINDFRRTFPVTKSIYLQFGRCTVKVSVNHLEMADALAAYFKPFVISKRDAAIVITAHEAPSRQLPLVFRDKTPDPGKTKIKEAYADLPDGRVVRKRLTDMLFVFNGTNHLAVGPCMQNLNQVVNFINNRFIEWQLCQGCLLGHAAGVVLNGKGLALAGFSGAGKSTLSLQLMNEGAVFVSNDRLMVEKVTSGLVMYGVAKMPRINPGTSLNNPALTQVMSDDERKRFSAMTTEELWDVEYKYDAPIDRCYGPGRFVLQAPMMGLVLLNWQRNSSPLQVSPVDLHERRDLLPAFMKSVGLFFLPQGRCQMPEPTEEAYADLLAHGKVWEFSGGADFEAAAKACLELCK